MLVRPGLISQPKRRATSHRSDTTGKEDWCPGRSANGAQAGTSQRITGIR